MTKYELTTVGQTACFLNDATRKSADPVARVTNTPKGWMAATIERRGSDLVSTCEPVNVSRLINQENGPEQIAKALGL